MTDRRGFLYAAIAFLLLALGVAALFGQQENFTITADDQATITVPANAPPMGSLIFYANGEPCELDALFAASDAMLAFFPETPDKPQPESAIYFSPLSLAEKLRAEADAIERKESAIKLWRDLAAKCSRIYKAVRDGVK